MEYKDYYKIIGVERNASDEDIKKSYRRLARKYHPDVSKEADAESRFKEIGEAYEVLKDPQKRESYDQLGANWKAGEQFRPPPGWESSGFGGFGGHAGGFNNASGFSDFFESVFGGGFGGHAGGHGFQQAGQDQNAAIKVSVQDAYHGANKTIRLQNGKSLQIKIPAGVTTGKKIRLAGQGSAGFNGGLNGDLYLEVTVESDARYEIQGKDIYVDVNIAPWEAALGEKVPLQTLDGQVEIKIPANSKSGRKMRLAGKGFPGSPAGDLYVRLLIVSPPANTADEKTFYEKMRETFNFDPRAK